LIICQGHNSVFNGVFNYPRNWHIIPLWKSRKKCASGLWGVTHTMPSVATRGFYHIQFNKNSKKIFLKIWYKYVLVIGVILFLLPTVLINIWPWNSWGDKSCVPPSLYAPDFVSLDVTCRTRTFIRGNSTWCSAGFVTIITLL